MLILRDLAAKAQDRLRVVLESVAEHHRVVKGTSPVRDHALIAVIEKPLNGISLLWVCKQTPSTIMSDVGKPEEYVHGAAKFR
jgi:hypothetical protein